MRTWKDYRQDMTAVQVTDFIQEVYPAEQAGSILARMGNGSSYGDAVRTVTGHPVVETYTAQVRNYIWYLQLHRFQGTCEILLHDAKYYSECTGLPASMGEYRIPEGLAKAVYEVDIRPCVDTSPGFGPVETLTVINPRPILAYPKFDGPLPARTGRPA